MRGILGWRRIRTKVLIDQIMTSQWTGKLSSMDQIDELVLLFKRLALARERLDMPSVLCFNAFIT